MTKRKVSEKVTASEPEATDLIDPGQAPVMTPDPQEGQEEAVEPTASTGVEGQGGCEDVNANDVTVLRDLPEAGAALQEEQRQDLQAEVPVPSVPSVKPRDPRLPPPGSTIRKVYKGTELLVLVTDEGFLFDGRPYGSLSKIAGDVTKQSVNGYLFFALGTTQTRKLRAPRPQGAGLVGKTARLETLTAKLRTAVAESNEALREAERMIAGLKAVVAAETIDQSGS